MKYLALFLFVPVVWLAVVSSTDTSAKHTCRNVIATRHQAWDGVFQHFPERLRSDVHGYIATDDCTLMGKVYDLSLGDAIYRVAVADCRNRSLPARKGQEQIDLDSRIWWAADFPNAPTPVLICEVP